MAIYNGNGLTSSQVKGGVTYCTIGGEAVDVVEASYDCSQWKRETLMGQSGVQGFSKNLKQGKIMLTLRRAQGFDTQSLNDMEGVTVIVQMADGTTVTGDQMWQVGDGIETDTKEGSCKVDFESASVVES